jgi:hypothetical protein
MVDNRDYMKALDELLDFIDQDFFECQIDIIDILVKNHLSDCIDILYKTGDSNASITIYHEDEESNLGVILDSDDIIRSFIIGSSVASHK